MSSGALPTPNPCCDTSCTEPVVEQIPGPQGPQGPSGSTGTDGIDAFTVLTAGFTMPAVGDSVTVSVSESGWAAPGQYVFVQNGGVMQVSSAPNSTSLILINTGASGNVAPTTAVANGSKITPSGPQGPAGPATSTTLNALSPTTTKGDLIADNGANSPSASDVRLAVGTDGQILRSLASAGTGLDWETLIPLGTATPAQTDNIIPRFDAAAGNEKPAPLQKSGLLISDTGAIQSTPTGGNARGASATDLQVERVAANDVASGANSVVAGGKSNKATNGFDAVVGGELNAASGGWSFVGAGNANAASGDSSGVACGASNAASDQNAFIGGGSTNTASALNTAVVGGSTNAASNDNASVLGGISNAASGNASVVAGGSSNAASAQYSAVIGGAQSVADKYGQVAHASGRFAANGDAQAFELVWRIATTDATPSEMFLDGASLPALIGVGHSWIAHIHIIGRRDNGDSAAWEVKFALKNNAGATTAIGAATTVLVGADAGCSGTWGQAANVVTDAYNTSDSLRIRVTGTAANNIRWVAHARIVEVAF